MQLQEDWDGDICCYCCMAEGATAGCCTEAADAWLEHASVTAWVWVPAPVGSTLPPLAGQAEIDLGRLAAVAVSCRAALIAWAPEELHVAG